MSESFDPNAAALEGSGIFGLPFSYDESSLVYLPVPWEATTSYGGGTSQGPNAILEASRQVDLFDADVLRPYECGLHLLPESPEVRALGEAARELATPIIELGGEINDDPALLSALDQVNNACNELNLWVESQFRQLLADGKIAALIGGDHSTPFGAFRAVAEHHPEFGILQIDAHSDTRAAFEGFQWSHASIMHNVLERIPQVCRLVQVGIRDFCEAEWKYCQAQGNRVVFVGDAELSRRRILGHPWAATASKIVNALPKDVWISFDIDGLDPRFCPNTGTPVPGGLDFSEANHLIGEVVRSGRRIIGFDLNEVAPDPAGVKDWDANVGARLLYKLSAWTLASRGLRTLMEPGPLDSDSPVQL